MCWRKGERNMNKLFLKTEERNMNIKFDKENIKTFTEDLLKDIYLEKVNKNFPTDLEAIKREDFIYKRQKEIAQFEGRDLNSKIYYAIEKFIVEIVINDKERENILNRLISSIEEELKAISLRNSQRNKENEQ